MQRKVIFDTETTGLSHQDGDRVIEIGAVEMVEGSLTGRTFHEYINPERDVPMEAYRIHRISTDMLRDKPLFSDPAVGPAFVAFVKGAELVAHNAAFDVGFIDAELERMGLPKLRNKITDTVPLARRKFPGSPASLDALCSRFGISKAEREAQGHGALLDSELLARVYIELTGGAQGGLSFDRPSSHEQGEGKGARQSRRRPAPLSSRITAEEDEAHRAFVATMGDKALWHQVN